jgi:hypothetical protein
MGQSTDSSISGDDVPLTEHEVAVAAAAVALPIPEACLPGVRATLRLLDRHAAILRGSGEAAHR